MEKNVKHCNARSWNADRPLRESLFIFGFIHKHRSGKKILVNNGSNLLPIVNIYNLIYV